MNDEPDEVMLAQEQGVIMRKAGVRKGLEGEFGFGGEVEGTLLLTNRRLVFVCSNEKEEELKAIPLTKTRLYYSDVEDLSSIPAVGDNLFIEISSISSVKGHAGHLTRPSLEVKWREGSKEKAGVFMEVVTGRTRIRNLNDWPNVIGRLKTGHQKLTQLPKPPGVETLDGKIMRILADMQRKGLFEIEQGVENRFNVKLDPDEVEAACQRLSDKGLLKKMPEPGGDVFYQKRSPLGGDELSA